MGEISGNVDVNFSEDDSSGMVSVYVDYARSVSVSFKEIDTPPTMSNAEKVLDISITVDGTSTGFNAKISIPLNVPSGMKAVVKSYADNGEFIEEHETSYSNGILNIYTDHTTLFAITLENDDSSTPTIPDDDELPFIPPQSTDNKGADTTTYVAVAAAAAVVAILAVLAVGISKGKL